MSKEDDIKGLIGSKTFWVNLLIGVLALTDYLMGTGWINPEVLVTITTVANIGLRIFTTKPISGLIGRKKK